MSDAPKHPGFGRLCRECNRYVLDACPKHGTRHVEPWGSVWPLDNVPRLEVARGGWRRVERTKRMEVYMGWAAAERGRSPVQLFEAWPAERVSIGVTTRAKDPRTGELLVPVIAYQRHAKQAGTWWHGSEVGVWSPWFHADGHQVAEDLEASDAPIAFAVGLTTGGRARADQRFGVVEVRVTVSR